MRAEGQERGSTVGVSSQAFMILINQREWENEMMIPRLTINIMPEPTGEIVFIPYTLVRYFNLLGFY